MIDDPSKKIKDVASIVMLINKFIGEFVSLVDPKEYKGNESDFVDVALSAPAMFAADVLDRLSGMYKVPHENIVELFLMKLSLACKMKNKNENPDQISNQ